MNDFVPMGQMNQTPLPAQNPPELPMEARANLELAKVAGDQRLLGLIAKSAVFAQFKVIKKIDNQIQYDQVIEAHDAAKKTIKELEDLRHTIVDYPTKVVNLINGFFKQCRDTIDLNKKHLGQLIDNKRREDEAELARLQAEEAARLAEQQATNEGGLIDEQQGNGDGFATVQIGSESSTPPSSNVVTSTRGVQAKTRTSTTIEVTHMGKFLTAIAGKNKSYKWLQEHFFDIVQVDTAKLKKVMDDCGKRSVPGITVKKETRTV